jgi:hypothetical protein
MMLSKMPDVMNLSIQKTDELHAASVFHKQDFNKLTETHTQECITNHQNSICNGVYTNQMNTN